MFSRHVPIQTWPSLLDFSVAARTALISVPRNFPFSTRASACAAAAAVYSHEPDVVIIAIHGMNDYAAAFKSAGAWWSAHGANVYAYDQRGFGRSPNWMIWPSHDVMRRDVQTAVEIARRINSAATVTPISLVALSLLSTPKQTADIRQLQTQIEHLQYLLDAVPLMASCSATEVWV